MSFCRGHVKASWCDSSRKRTTCTATSCPRGQEIRPEANASRKCFIEGRSFFLIIPPAIFLVLVRFQVHSSFFRIAADLAGEVKSALADPKNRDVSMCDALSTLCLPSLEMRCHLDKTRARGADVCDFRTFASAGAASASASSGCAKANQSRAGESSKRPGASVPSDGSQPDDQMTKETILRIRRPASRNACNEDRSTPASIFC